MSFLAYLGDLVSRKRTLAWALAFVISAAPFLFLRFFMGWQNQSFFANGVLPGILIKDLLPDSCYVCVAVGLAYWSDLFLTKRQFEPLSSFRIAALNYINIILVVVMVFAGVLYFVSSLVDKKIFVTSFDPTELIRGAVTFLFFTIVTFTFVGEQLLHELESRQGEHFAQERDLLLQERQELAKEKEALLMIGSSHPVAR